MNHLVKLIFLICFAVIFFKSCSTFSKGGPGVNTEYILTVSGALAVIITVFYFNIYAGYIIMIYGGALLITCLISFMLLMMGYDESIVITIADFINPIYHISDKRDVWGYSILFGPALLYFGFRLILTREEEETFERIQDHIIND
jgi:hypothetical protein